MGNEILISFGDFNLKLLILSLDGRDNTAPDKVFLLETHVTVLQGVKEKSKNRGYHRPE